MRNTYLRPVIAGIALLGLVGACSDDEDESFPIGVYTAADATEVDGTMEYKEDGTYVMLSPTGTEITVGEYTIDGDQITYVDDQYCTLAHGEEAARATYTWDWDGTEMTFELEGTDVCTARVETMARTAVLVEG
jgi:hypothetical protein